jgi:hypothetical protein
VEDELERQSRRHDGTERVSNHSDGRLRVRMSGAVTSVRD